MNLENLLSIPPFSLKVEQKREILEQELASLCEFHFKNCKEYADFMRFLGFYGDFKNLNLEQIPFISTDCFKEFSLSSTNEIFKTAFSSGSGGKPSKILLDRTTASLQQKVLSIISQEFLGKMRMPMIILGYENLLSKKDGFSAQSAAVAGFGLFAKEKIFAFDSFGNIKIKELKEFAKKHERIFVFGFSFMVWEFVQKILKMGENLGIRSGILLHGGGWKKLQNIAVSKEEFTHGAKAAFSIKDDFLVRDYYGMIESAGAIFFECECGYFHASNFSDCIVRDERTLAPLGFKKQGFLEIVSIVPRSYCGHCVLSGDLGEIVGEDDCACGRMGKYFKVFGRAKGAEIRGCSDAVNLTDSIKNDVKATKFIESNLDSMNKSENSDEINIKDKNSEILHGVKFILGDSTRLFGSLSRSSDFIFSPLRVKFLSTLGERLFVKRREFSDLGALGFWLRWANLNNLAKNYAKEMRLGRGVAFSSCPSNVPLNFAFSAIVSFLAGCVAIIRLPRKDFEAGKIFISELESLLSGEFADFKNDFIFLKCERKDSEKFLDFIAQNADVRLLWGGDESVLRECARSSKPRSIDLKFADRFSCALINARAVLEADSASLERLCAGFFADVFSFSQNACNSPSAIFWVGDCEIQKAQKIFWNQMQKLSKNYQMPQNAPLQKLALGFIVANKFNAKSENLLSQTDFWDLSCFCVNAEMKFASEILRDFRGNCGFFYEFCAKELEDVFIALDDEKMQTLSYFGFKKEILAQKMQKIRGVDRIVKIGRAADFGLLWDGYDLIRFLSRIVDC